MEPAGAYTLDAIVRRNAARFPDKAALVMHEDERSWAALEARVARIAGALAAAGLVRGERVALLLGNCPEYIELYLGIARAGLIAVPVNYRLKAHELAAILNQAEPALLVLSGQYVGQAQIVAGRVPSLGAHWVLGPDTGGLPGAATLAAAIAGAAEARAVSPAAADDPFAIFYTSGTTGLPKGAMVSHHNLEANAYNQAIADAARAEDINLIGTPLYHMGAVFMAVTYMLLGCTQVILPTFEPKAWLETLAARRASVALLVPTMINAVLHEPALAQTDLSSLRRVFYGGGPMPPAVLRRALAELDCGFTQGYGLTETLEATFLTASDHVLDGDPEREARLASAGREAVGAEVRVCDEAGRDLPAGEVGEILVRSRSVIAGYWNNTEETAAAIREGWFHTGDLGYLDEDRYLFVVDRKKDVVISGGVNIYTKEIEAVLYQHPAVAEAAVIGLPDERWGEAVTAVVALKPGAAAAAGELIGWCREHLAGYKKPQAVHFMDVLPKNPSGKILKRELRSALA